MIGRCARLIVYVGIFLQGVSAARADPLLITSGFASFPLGDPGEVQIAGSNFIFASRAGGGDTARRFPVGSMVELSGSIVNDPYDTETTFAMLNGVVYQSQFLDPPNYLVMSLAFVATPFVASAPDAADMFRTVFTLTGNVRAFRSLAAGESPLFDVHVAGEGSLTIDTIRRFDPDTWGSVGEFRFDFRPPAAPVPEPMSLFLLGSGLAGVLARSRLRKLRG